MDIKTLALLFRDVRHRYVAEVDRHRYVAEVDRRLVVLRKTNADIDIGTVLSAHPIVVFLAKEERGHQNPRSSVSRCTASSSTNIGTVLRHNPSSSTSPRRSADMLFCFEMYGTIVD